MTLKESIDAGLTVHGKWKKNLQSAVAEGKSEFKVDVVAKDNECQFGKWLYSLSEKEKESKEWENAVALHAEFHKIASGILDLALKGKKEEALKKIEFGGDYGTISGKLVLCLNTWKSKLPG